MPLYNGKPSHPPVLISYDKTVSTATYGLKEQRKRIREWAKNNLIGKLVYQPQIGRDVTITARGIKEALNQPHKHVRDKNEAIVNIPDAIASGSLIKTEADSNGNSNYVYHYFKTIINDKILTSF